MRNVEVAKALFEALAGKDDQAVRRLCSPDLCVRQKNGQPLGLDTLLAFNAAVGRVATDLRYDDAVRSDTASGFVRGGKVSDVREYFDSAAAADLIAALGIDEPGETAAIGGPAGQSITSIRQFLTRCGHRPTQDERQKEAPGCLLSRRLWVAKVKNNQLAR